MTRRQIVELINRPPPGLLLTWPIERIGPVRKLSNGMIDAARWISRKYAESQTYADFTDDQRAVLLRLLLNAARRLSQLTDYDCANLTGPDDQFRLARLARVRALFRQIALVLNLSPQDLQREITEVFSQ
jgi:hypothetical protein